jgi:hypothetical protein
MYHEQKTITYKKLPKIVIYMNMIKRIFNYTKLNIGLEDYDVLIGSLFIHVVKMSSDKI